MYFLLIRYYPRKKNFDNSSLNSLAFGNDCWNKTSNRNKNSPLDSKPVILPQIPSLFSLSLSPQEKEKPTTESIPGSHYFVQRCNDFYPVWSFRGNYSPLPLPLVLEASHPLSWRARERGRRRKEGEEGGVGENGRKGRENRARPGWRPRIRVPS